MAPSRTIQETAKTAGAELAHGARVTGNRVSVPLAWNLGLGDFLRATAERTGRCQVFAHSGNIAFRGLFALFPALIALLWLLTVLDTEQLMEGFFGFADAVLPQTARDPIHQVLRDVPRDQASGALTLGVLASVAAAGWALASAMRAMMNGLNAIYGVPEGRSFWRSTLVSVLLAAALSVLLLAALFLVVFGTAVGRHLADALGWGLLGRWAWQILLWPALALLVLSAMVLLYYAAPDVQQRGQWVSMGALLATALWLLFSVLYSVYVSRLASYQDLYGALAGIVVLMAYFYGSAFVFLLGAVMNQVIEESHPDGKTLGEHAPHTGAAGEGQASA